MRSSTRAIVLLVSAGAGIAIGLLTLPRPNGKPFSKSLTRAVEHANIDMVRKELASHPDLNFTSPQQQRLPLTSALFSLEIYNMCTKPKERKLSEIQRRQEIVRLLLEAGASPDKPSKFDAPPKALCLSIGEPKAMALLVEHGARFEDCTLSDIERLAYATVDHDIADYESTLRIAMKAGLDLNERDEFGRNLAFYVAHYAGSDLPEVRKSFALLLVKLGLKMNLKDNNGYTPVDYTASKKKANWIQSLAKDSR